MRNGTLRRGHAPSPRARLLLERPGDEYVRQIARLPWRRAARTGTARGDAATDFGTEDCSSAAVRSLPTATSARRFTRRGATALSQRHGPSPGGSSGQHAARRRVRAARLGSQISALVSTTSRGRSSARPRFSESVCGARGARGPVGSGGSGRRRPYGFREARITLSASRARRRQPRTKCCAARAARRACAGRAGRAVELWAVGAAGKGRTAA